MTDKSSCKLAVRAKTEISSTPLTPESILLDRLNVRGIQINVANNFMSIIDEITESS